MPQLGRAIILTSALALSASAVVLKTSRAADEPPGTAERLAPPAGDPARTATDPARHAVDSTRPPGVEGPPTGPSHAAAPLAKPGAPQVPEESATIRDDPTIAPDPKQSADNNVSFPNDI